MPDKVIAGHTKTRPVFTDMVKLRYPQTTSLGGGGGGGEVLYLTAVKDHVMKYSETAFSNSNVNYFGPLKTLPRSSKSCDCVTFRVLKYLLSTFLLYTPHCHMIWSKQKCCLWSTGGSTESQNLTSVFHLRQDFLATRNMTRIDVGLARSYVKLLLSSLKTYMCNLMAWYINK